MHLAEHYFGNRCMETGLYISILYKNLGMRNLLERWVPYLLTMEWKRNRVTTLEHCFDMFNRNSKEFLRRFVTVHETLIISTRQKQKISPKIVAQIAILIQRKQYLHWLYEAKDITGKYYADLLGRFDAKLMRKQPHLLKEVFF